MIYWTFRKPSPLQCILLLLASLLTAFGSVAAGRADSPSAVIAGAQIHETKAKIIITVQPDTLRSGFLKARINLAAGIATKIVLRPGVYRESLADLTWSAGKAQDTLLVIEGTPGRTIWTGADVFPLSTWKKTPDGLLVHDWSYQFGNLGNFWAPHGNIAFRREMAFIDNTALRPQVLETYQIGGLSYTQSTGVTYKYTGLRDPAKTLKPGDFGVIERPENGGGRILLRLPVGVTPEERSIELSVRPLLLNFGGKKNLVLRGIDFVRCANPMPDADHKTPGLASGTPVAFESDAGNILVDHCRFLWNSGTALAVAGTAWTVRDSVFNYNGLSGISGDSCHNIVLDGNETSFNCWRSWRAGENDWSYGGIKMHQTVDQRVVRHLALANCSTGLWWDISCRRVDVSDSISLANACSDLKYEFSYGPFHGQRLVLGGSKWGPTYICTTSGSGLLESSVLYKNYPKDHDKDPVPVASLLSYRRGDEPKDPPINRGTYALTDVVIVAGPLTPLILGDEWWSDPKDDAANWGGSRTVFQSVTRRNIYWSLGHAPRFDVHLSSDFPVNRDADWPFFQQQAADTGSRLVGPQLRDPEAYDFRFASSSPLYRERSRWPQFKLPVARLKEMHAFSAWLLCPPAGPGAPPQGEP